MFGLSSSNLAHSENDVASVKYVGSLSDFRLSASSVLSQPV